ncbi:MAG: cyclic nucleotide-binding and patatin-like phospholipase domain-containing protein [Rhodomicrobium sp.]
MEAREPYIRLLASLPAFAALDEAQLQTLYAFCALKIVAKGETASVAGEAVDELGIVVSGRLSALEPGMPEAGQGAPVEPGAFFKRQPAQATAVALRETVLLTLAWDDFADALRTSPALLAATISRFWPEGTQAGRAPGKLSRLVVCPAGSQRYLEPGLKDALLAALESLGEVRVLRSGSFGAGMPGALALDSPGIAHWFQEQELEFDITLIVTDETELDFAKEAIGEADGILFIASGGDAGLSALERHAVAVRGAQNCFLLLAKTGTNSIRDAAAWIEPRRYRLAQSVDFTAPEAVRLLSQAFLGKGNAIAAASSGVHAAAIFGALLAFEEHGLPAVCLAAAGSAVLPAGLLACGKLSAGQAIFRELANPLLWKRASRVEAGLCDPAALDNFLVGALKGLEVPAACRPFAAVSRSLSADAPEVHREGRLHGPVRAGIAPPGILPPLILEGGDILVSGENETGAILAAAEGLSASPIVFLRAKPPPLGASPMSYRSLTGASLFRLTQTPPDKRLRLETVLGAVAGTSAAASGPRFFAIPIAEGIMPMDWPQWTTLRDAAYDWVSRELETRHLASDYNSPA